MGQYNESVIKIAANLFSFNWLILFQTEYYLADSLDNWLVAILGVGLLVGQNGSFEDVTLDIVNLWHFMD